MVKPLYSSKQFIFYPDAEKAWELIEMGKDIDELYPDSYKTEKLEDNYYKQIIPALLEGEECKMLDGKLFGYAITSYARIINVAKNNISILLYFGQNDVTSLVRTIKVSVRHEFSKNGWPFVYEDIKKMYKDNNWKIKIRRNQTEYL